MTAIPHKAGSSGGFLPEEAHRALDRLDRIKARQFPPETRTERAARALEALRMAVKKSGLDAAALKHIAQSADLESI